MPSAMSLPVLRQELLTHVLRAERLTAREILAEGRTAAKLCELAGNAHQYAEDTVGVVYQTSKLPPFAAACREGCAHCCSLTVEIHPVEAICLAEYLRASLTAEQIEATLVKLEALESRTYGLGQFARANVEDTRCALLGEDDRCTVYPVRPLGCRQWVSASEEGCAAWQGNAHPDLKVRTDAVRLALYQCVRHGLEQGVRESGLPSAPVELTSALLIALRTPDASERYLRGERIFARALITHFKDREAPSICVSSDDLASLSDRP